MRLKKLMKKKNLLQEKNLNRIKTFFRKVYEFFGRKYKIFKKIFQNSDNETNLKKKLLHTVYFYLEMPLT